ncbi:uncharacterized protein LOC119741952 [Patiria miniata]|uniref:Uncharacterized protein n=1 Tax=Patiria miniata TaxID=46514 RepID=A0A914BC94_PATMI|nr:uncharacterized protein LOC119741952 [Patiria miniata]
MDEGKTTADQPTHGWRHRVLRILRIPAVKVLRVFRRPIRKHRSGLGTLPTYGATEDCDETLLSSMTQGEQQNDDHIDDSIAATDDGPKRSLRKRMTKTLRRWVQHYGYSALLCGSPLSTAYIARDIQQRITLNHEYVEMLDLYMPSCVFY